jgi:hypothetical protein
MIRYDKIIFWKRNQCKKKNRNMVKTFGKTKTSMFRLPGVGCREAKTSTEAVWIAWILLTPPSPRCRICYAYVTYVLYLMVEIWLL